MNPFEVDDLKKMYDGFAPGYDDGRGRFDNREQLAMLAERPPAEKVNIIFPMNKKMPYNILQINKLIPLRAEYGG